MPYIITTLHPWADANEPARRARTHTAVATIGAAREACHATLTTCDLNPAAQFDAQYEITYRVNESGGTVGPLPDGTVIEVRRVSLTELSRPLPLTPGLHRAIRDNDMAYVLAAFNRN